MPSTSCLATDLELIRLLLDEAKTRIVKAAGVLQDDTRELRALEVALREIQANRRRRSGDQEDDATAALRSTNCGPIQ